MGLKTLMARLQCRATVPFVPFEKLAEGTREPAWIKAVPPVSPVPPHIAEAGEIMRIVQFGEAGNDLAAATPQPAAMPDPDSSCWPHSSAMTGREIDTMAERTSLFNRRGLPALEAELLADRLVTRDRDDFDTRKVCLECAHLSGRAGAMRCTQWQRAGLGQPGIPVGMELVLQRCDGFEKTIGGTP